MMKGAALSVALVVLLGGSAVLGQEAKNPFEAEGCLRLSGSQYVLIDRDGTFQQVSHLKKLKSLVGHEVKLSGKQTIRTIDTTPPGGASSAKEQPYFQVQSAQDIKPSCEGYAPLK